VAEPIAALVVDYPLQGEHPEAGKQFFDKYRMYCHIRS
jgi:hypothetical protein